MRSRTINDLLKKAISNSGKKDLSLQKIDKHDSVLRELVALVSILSQEQIATCDSKHKDASAKALKKRIKHSLSELDQIASAG